MAANRCSMCGISWPTSKKTCPKCGQPTDYISNDTPDDDWEDQVSPTPESEQILKSPEMKIAHNRFERFSLAGLDATRALELAGDKNVDLHLFERMVKQGCDVDTAYRIVS